MDAGGGLARLKWRYVYWKDGELHWVAPQMISVDAHTRTTQNIDIRMHDMTVQLAHRNWQLQDCGGVCVPQNICEIYATATGNDDDIEELSPIIMQIVYPQHMVQFEPIDPKLYAYVERHCLHVPLRDMFEDKTLHRMPERGLMVTVSTSLSQGGPFARQLKYNIEAEVMMRRVVQHRGPVQFSHTWMSVTRIKFAGVRHFPVGRDGVMQNYESDSGDWWGAEDDLAPEDAGNGVIDIPSDGEDVVDVTAALPATSPSTHSPSTDAGKRMYTLAHTKTLASVADIDTLLPRRLVNDAILHYLLGSLKPLQAGGPEYDDIYVFSSFMLPQLVLQPKAARLPFRAQVRSNFEERLRRWAVVDEKCVLFTKTCIMVPYCYRNIHWLLYVVHQPYARDARGPLVYIFDSSPSVVPDIVHRRNVEGLCEYFRAVAREHVREDLVDCVDKTRGVVEADAPTQTEYWNCGLFLFCYCKALIVPRVERERVLRNVADGRAVFPAVTSMLVDRWRRYFHMALVKLPEFRAGRE